MLNAAIVGLGNWGRKIVAAVETGVPLFRIEYAVVRELREEIRAYARGHALTPVTDFQHVLANPAIDAVIIATPHSQHVAQIVAAANAGKHVFCEKPLALTRADAERAVDACMHAGRVLMAGHDKRYLPSMVALQAAVAGGTLGQILHVEGHTSNENSGAFAAWRAQPLEAPGGGMTGAGIHMLDALIRLGGPLASVNAQLLAARGGADPRDAVSALLRFKSNISGTLATVRATPYYWRAHVFGDAGSAEALGPSRIVLRRRGGGVEARDFGAVDTLRAEMTAFEQAMTDGQNVVDADGILATVHGLEAIIASMKGGTRVDLA